jgi:EAL domain-containing protein (putative c-di-GMP-specific phosphodiesterase class I)
VREALARTLGAQGAEVVVSETVAVRRNEATTAAVRDAVERLGCDLMQGFLFAEPGDAFPVPRF